jgi:tetratricopeptide (TPR) repeat protein
MKTQRSTINIQHPTFRDGCQVCSRARWARLIAILLFAAPASFGAILEETDESLFREGESAVSAMGRSSVGATNESDRLAVADEGIEKDLATQIAEARKEVAANPRSTRQLKTLGELLTRANRLDEAAEAYWKASRLEPLNAGTLHYFGFTLLALGDHKNGLDVYKQLEVRYPDARKVIFNLAAAHYGLRQYDRALRYAESYVDSAVRDEPKANFNMGVILLARGDPAGAARWLGKSESMMPANPYLLAALIRANTELDNKAEITRLKKLAEFRFGLDAIMRLVRTGELPVFLDR